MLAAEVADRLTLDLYPHCHRVVGIVIFKHEAGFNTTILALLGTRTTDCLDRVLIVRFADDWQRERTGTPQVCSHAWRRTTGWRLAKAEETTEEPHCHSPA